jgi:transposase
MFNGSQEKITDLSRVFLQPTNPTHRQYEALRAYFVDNLSNKEAARRFGYSEGSFRVLVHHFRQDPHRPFFLPPAKGPHKTPRKDNVREKVIALRKENLSIYDISHALDTKGHPISPVSVSLILKEEGFAKLPRRGDEERPPATRVSTAAVADQKELDLTPRQVRTQFGGIFLFLPFLAAIPLDQMVTEARFPGSKMVPAGHAIRALLALKLFGVIYPNKAGDRGSRVYKIFGPMI